MSKVTRSKLNFLIYILLQETNKINRKFFQILNDFFTMKQKLPGSQKSANYPLKLLIAYFELNW